MIVHELGARGRHSLAEPAGLSEPTTNKVNWDSGAWTNRLLGRPVLKGEEVHTSTCPAQSPNESGYRARRPSHPGMERSRSMSDVEHDKLELPRSGLRARRQRRFDLEITHDVTFSSHV